MFAKLGRVLPEALQRYFADRCPQHSAAISYRVLFSIAPLAIVLVAIFGLVLQNDVLRKDVVEHDRRRAAGLGRRQQGRRGRDHGDRDARERGRARQPRSSSSGPRPG